MTPRLIFYKMHPDAVQRELKHLRARRARRLRQKNPGETARARYAANPEKFKKAVASSREKHAEKYRETAKAWKARNKEKLREKSRRYAATPEGRAAHCAKMARRNAKKRMAFVPWADPVAIRAIYREAARLTKETGIPHEVDHIVPLSHPLICGLHVEGNLQVLTAETNRLKNNQWPWSPAGA